MNWQMMINGILAMNLKSRLRIQIIINSIKLLEVYSHNQNVWHYNIKDTMDQ
jgi:hypothetical protein